METQDEFSDRDPDISVNASNTGGGVVPVALVVAHGENSNAMDQQSTPEDSRLSHQEEDPSDSDLQDEESGEEFIQQPHQSNVQSPLDVISAQVGQPQPTSIAHLNNLMANPHFLSKLSKIESPELLKTGGLEALQAALNTGNFGMPLAFTSQFLKHQQNNHVQTTSFGSQIPGNQMVVSPVHHSDSSQGNGMNGGEVRDGSGNLHNSRAECSSVTSNNVAGPSRQATSSQASQQQQQNWTYEEQFKQLYEISDDPKRKEFLDDLFSFMQKRGQPINRLPIMAKSVLDLYELYNLVVARGGLVDVINKKLWQEIIKGLHLPSSITSAAFTLRTQYQKHLYEYECHKQRLSTPVELKQAIDGNRREGRRSSYSGENVMQRNQVQHHTQNSLTLHPQIQLPLPGMGAVSPAAQHHKTQWLNGNAHTPMSHHPHHPQHPQGLLGQVPNSGPLPGLAPSSDLLSEYVKQLNQLNNVCSTQSPLILRQGSGSPRSSTPPRDVAGLSAVEVYRLTSWYNSTMYPNVTHHPLSPQGSHSPLQTANSPEPQREALDLGVRSPASSSPAIQSPQPPSGGSIPAKRDRQSAVTPRTPAGSIKRRFSSDDESQINAQRKSAALIVQGQRISISTQEGDGENGNSVAVSIDLNGITYEGVLFAQNDSNATSPASTTANSNTKTSRSLT